MWWRGGVGLGVRRSLFFRVIFVNLFCFWLCGDCCLFVVVVMAMGVWLSSFVYGYVDSRDRLYSAKRKMPENERKVRNYGIWKSKAAALVLFAGLFGLVGCSGVSQEEFDRVSEDLNDTRAQEQRISNDLAVAQSKVKDIETELTDTENELDDARAKLAGYSKIVETDYPDLSRRAEQARLILAVLLDGISC